MGEIINLSTCSRCGRPAPPDPVPLVFRGEQVIAQVDVCNDCLSKTNRELASVRPIFEKMLECGVSRELANEVMTYLLERRFPMTLEEAVARLQNAGLFAKIVGSPIRHIFGGAVKFEAAGIHGYHNAFVIKEEGDHFWCGLSRNPQSHDGYKGTLEAMVALVIENVKPGETA